MINSSKLLSVAGFSAALANAVELEASAAQNGNVVELPALTNFNADPNSVTVSGHSAGAHYSNSLAVILSGTFKGAGISKGATFLTRFD